MRLWVCYVCHAGYQLVLKTASRYGKAIELRDLSKTPPEDPIVKRVQVPHTQSLAPESLWPLLR